MRNAEDSSRFVQKGGAYNKSELSAKTTIKQAIAWFSSGVNWGKDTRDTCACPLQLWMCIRALIEMCDVRPLLHLPSLHGAYIASVLHPHVSRQNQLQQV
jgi:hypothetical protein